MNAHIIFCLSAQHAEYGVSYIKNNPDLRIKLFAPTTEAQLILLKNHFPFQDYFIKEYFSDKFYTEQYWDREKKAVKLSSQILDFLKYINSAHYDYFKSLQNRFELCCLEVIEAYDFFKAIEKKYKPDKYIYFKDAEVYTSSIYYPLASQATLICKEFAGNRAQLIDLHLRNYQIHKSTNIIQLMKANLNVNPALLIFNRLLRKTGFLVNKPSGPVDVIFFSAGRNLYTYNKLIQLLLKSRLKIQIITGKQTVRDESLINKLRIPFLPLHYFSDRKIIYESERTFKKIDVTSIDFKKILVTKEFPSQHYDNFIDVLANRLLQVAKDNLANSISQSLLAKKIISNLKPSLVITTHDPGPTAMPFVLEAKKRNLQTLVLMHGWQETIFNTKHKSKHIAVWGKYIAKWYEKKIKIRQTHHSSIGISSDG